jgi:hypothetical protein
MSYEKGRGMWVFPGNADLLIGVGAGMGRIQSLDKLTGLMNLYYSLVIVIPPNTWSLSGVVSICAKG